MKLRSQNALSPMERWKFGNEEREVTELSDCSHEDIFSKQSSIFVILYIAFEKLESKIISIYVYDIA